jgi:hypothetical protein
MQPSSYDQKPCSGSVAFELFTKPMSNLNKEDPPRKYWIKWKSTGNYYFEGDSLMQFIVKINNLQGLPRLMQCFEFSHNITK